MLLAVVTVSLVRLLWKIDIPAHNHNALSDSPPLTVATSMLNPSLLASFTSSTDHLLGSFSQLLLVPFDTLKDAATPSTGTAQQLGPVHFDARTTNPVFYIPPCYHRGRAWLQIGSEPAAEMLAFSLSEMCLETLDTGITPGNRSVRIEPNLCISCILYTHGRENSRQQHWP